MSIWRSWGLSWGRRRRRINEGGRESSEKVEQEVYLRDGGLWNRWVSCCYLVVFILDNAFFGKWRARDWLAMMMKKSTTVAVLGNTATFGNGYQTRCRKGQSLEWKGFYSCSLHSKKRSKWQQHRPNFAGFSCIETTYHGGNVLATRFITEQFRAHPDFSISSPFGA